MNYKNLLKAFIVSSITIFIFSLVNGMLFGVAVSTVDLTENNIRTAAYVELVFTLMAIAAGAFMLISFKDMTKEVAAVGAMAGATLNIIVTVLILPPKLVWNFQNFFGTTYMEDLTNAVRLSYSLQVVGGVLIAGLVAYLVGRVKLLDFWSYQKKNQILLIVGSGLGAAIIPSIMNYAIFQTISPTFIAYGSIGLAVGLFLAFFPDNPMNIMHALILAVLCAFAGGIGRAIAYDGDTVAIGVITGAGIGFVTALTYRRPTWMFLFLPVLAAGLSRGIAESMEFSPNSNPLLSVLFTSGAALGMTSGLMISFRQTSERVSAQVAATSFALPQNGAQFAASMQNIQDRVRNNARRGAFEAGKLRQVTNIRVKSGSLAKEVDNKYAAFGELAYSLQQQRQANFPTLHNDWRDIWQLQQTLQTTETQLAALKKAGYQDEANAGLLSTGVGKAAFEAEKLRQSRTLQGQIKTMQNEYQQKLTLAGQQLYQLHQTDQLPKHTELTRHGEEIAALQAALSDYETEMAALQEESYVSEQKPAPPEPSLPESTMTTTQALFCIQCGESLQPEAQFCMSCGTAVVVEQPIPQTEEPSIPTPPITSAPQILLVQGITQVKKNELAAGIQSLQQVIKQSPDGSSSAWLWLGIAFAKQNNQDAAQKCFQKAKQLGNPQADKALSQLQNL